MRPVGYASESITKNPKETFAKSRPIVARTELDATVRALGSQLMPTSTMYAPTRLSGRRAQANTPAAVNPQLTSTSRKPSGKSVA